MRPSKSRQRFQPEKDQNVSEMRIIIIRIYTFSSEELLARNLETKTCVYLSYINAVHVVELHSDRNM